MQIWNTDLAVHGDRRSYWADVVKEAIFELEFESDDPQMRASLSQCALGAIRHSAVSMASGHQITRSAQAVRRNRNPHFNLNYLRSGAFHVTHCGKDLWLGPGDMVLLDNRHPYQVASTSQSEHVSVHIPVDWLQSVMPQPESGVAQVIRAGSPWQAALASMLVDAPRLPLSESGMSELGCRQIAGALALALGPVESANSSHTRLLLVRAREFIAVHYHEQELSAEIIAAAMGISVRYLYRIFSRENTTLGREILASRLEHAATTLQDSRFDDVSIAEISWRCGFSDPSYFSKCFSTRYRVSPGAFRKAAREKCSLNS